MRILINEDLAGKVGENVFVMDLYRKRYEKPGDKAPGNYQADLLRFPKIEEKPEEHYAKSRVFYVKGPV